MEHAQRGPGQRAATATAATTITEGGLSFDSRTQNIGPRVARGPHRSVNAVAPHRPRPNKAGLIRFASSAASFGGESARNFQRAYGRTEKERRRRWRRSLDWARRLSLKGGGAFPWLRPFRNRANSALYGILRPRESRSRPRRFLGKIVSAGTAAESRNFTFSGLRGATAPIPEPQRKAAPCNLSAAYLLVLFPSIPWAECYLLRASMTNDPAGRPLIKMY